MEQHKPIKLYFIVAVILLVFAIIFNLATGASTISFPAVIRSLLGFEKDDVTNIIVREIRFPRALTALTVGATLAASGVLIRAVLKNPLADTGILGVQSGATVVAMIILLVLPALYNFLPLAAFLGGILTYLLITLIAFKKRIVPIRLVLAGIAINGLMGAIIGFITIFNSDKIQGVLFWLNGSLVGVRMNDAKILLIYSTIVLSISFLFIKKCNLLLLDDTTIRTLGENLSLTRFIVATISVLLASISVAFVGIIGFVGLVIPHIAKSLVGQNHKFLLPFSIILGSTLILLADGVQKAIFAPMEIPVGIVISLLGAPFFLYLLAKQE